MASVNGIQICMLLAAPQRFMLESTLDKREDVSDLYQMKDSDMDHENVIIMQCLSRMVRSVYSNATRYGI